mgnify:CR=1 FL=1
MTPLQFAAQSGHAQMVDLLLQEYPIIDISHQDQREQTALQAAQSNGHDEVVQMLQEHLQKQVLNYLIGGSFDDTIHGKAGPNLLLTDAMMAGFDDRSSSLGFELGFVEGSAQHGCDDDWRDGVKDGINDSS